VTFLNNEAGAKFAIDVFLNILNTLNSISNLNRLTFFCITQLSFLHGYKQPIENETH